MTGRKPVDWRYLVNGLDSAVWEWPGRDPAVILCHATGFHGRCWDQVVVRLPGRRCIALDFRGHGRSAKPDPPYHWRRFGEDLAPLVREIGLRDAIGVGHSMGGHAAVLAAALVPEAFRALLLLDPVILTEAEYCGPTEPLEFVLRRKNVWKSPDEMFERFRGKPPYQSWDMAVLRDYCDYAINGSTLACPPEVEASIYAHSGELDANIYAEVGQVEAPVHVVRSRERYSYGKFDGSPTAPDLACRFRRGIDQHRADVSHFIPMEAPAMTAAMILNF